MPKNQKIVIVGLGLMGASLGLAVRKKFPRSKIVGVSRSQSTIRQAIRKKIVHSGTTRLEEALPGAWLVILSTPLGLAEKKLLEIDRFADLGTIVTDVGSVKGKLMHWADGQKFRRIQFVGSHPMAGSHRRGIAAARPDLYQNSICFVLEGKRTSLVALRQVTQFWRAICGKVAITDPRTHDRIVAEISHLPHVLASLLVASVDPKLFDFAGPGFRDTTRIAQGGAELWREIITENRSFILEELKDFRRNLDRFLTLLEKNKSKKIFQLFDHASRIRQKL